MEDNYETLSYKLTNSSGENISVQGYSAPAMIDINGDGL